MQVRSGQQQMNDEIHEMYKLMTDPEEQEKQRIAKEEDEQLEAIIEDAGL